MKGINETQPVLYKMEFISQIIRSNFFLHQGAIYIKSAYLDLFIDSKKLLDEPIIHRGRGYIRLDSIPKEMLDLIRIPEIRLIYQELYKEYPTIQNPYFHRYLNSLKNSLLEVVRDCSPFLQTYSDYKLDAYTMKRKALTHAVMYFVVPFLKKFPGRYDAVYELLRELNPDIELPLSSLEKFYPRVNEIIRAGLPNALVQDLPRPLDSS
jgi:hypothetical protein